MLQSGIESRHSNAVNTRSISSQNKIKIRESATKSSFKNVQDLADINEGTIDSLKRAIYSKDIENSF